MTEKKIGSEAEIGHAVLPRAEAVVVLEHGADDRETDHGVGICDGGVIAQAGTIGERNNSLKDEPRELDGFPDQ